MLVPRRGSKFKPDGPVQGRPRSWHFWHEALESIHTHFVLPLTQARHGSILYLEQRSVSCPSVRPPSLHRVVSTQPLPERARQLPKQPTMEQDSRFPCRTRACEISPSQTAVADQAAFWPCALDAGSPALSRGGRSQQSRHVRRAEKHRAPLGMGPSSAWQTGYGQLWPHSDPQTEVERWGKTGTGTSGVTKGVR